MTEIAGMESGCVCHIDHSTTGTVLQMGTNGKPQFASAATIKITPPTGYTATTVQALLNEIAARL